MDQLSLSPASRSDKATTLTVVDDDGSQQVRTEKTALNAQLPDAALGIPADERGRRLRRGADTVLIDEYVDGQRHTRGFVKCVLRVPLHEPEGATYGVYVEVDKDGYRTLQQAFRDKRPVKVWGRLANRLPLLEDAFDSGVEILEDGSELRARVVDARHPLLLSGPEIGPAT